MQLAAAVRKMGRGYEQLANLAGSQAVSENVSLSDSLGYQALNARAAKVRIVCLYRRPTHLRQDVLLQRVQTLEDSQFATKTAINKRRQVERLRGSSSISPVKVDEAIHEMDQVSYLKSCGAAQADHTVSGKRPGTSTLGSTQRYISPSSRRTTQSFAQYTRRCGVSVIGECSSHRRFSQTLVTRARGPST